MRTFALLWFDTEDYITPESDDALLLLLRMLKERKCPATFKLVAEKVRVLWRRGRSDVLELLHEFEIGYHTDFHSLHPTIAEYCEDMGFAEGEKAFYARESPGWQDVGLITGQPTTCFGQPGGSWAPQVYPALRRMGIPVYMDAHDVIDGEGRPYWFGGLLNVLDIGSDGTHRMPLAADGMTTTRANYAWWKRVHAEEEISFLNIYYHPCEFSCTKFFDGINFARGENAPREAWQPAPLRAPGEMERLVAQLGEFVDFLRAEGAELITPSRLIALECSGKGEVPAEIVRAFADSAARGRVDTIARDGFSLSCVEGLSLVARMLLGKPLTPSFAYGPDAGRSTGLHGTSAKALAEAVCAFFGAAGKTDQLPARFAVGDALLTPLDAAVALSRAVILGEETIDLRVPRGFLVPETRINPDDDWSGWVIHAQDFHVPGILNLARAQMWTYKPAIF